MSFILALLLALPMPPAASQPAPAPGLTLRVASYNTWLMPFVSDALNARRVAMGPALAALEPDLVCLQETWDRDGTFAVRTHLVLAARPLPFTLIADGGLAFASRYPILAARFTPFTPHPDLPLHERLAKKGWLEVLVATPLGPVRVVNTHLVWAGRDGGGAHAAQLEELQAALRPLRDAPVILCGDLNHRATRDGSPTREYAGWLEDGFVDAALPTLDRDTPPGAWPTRPRTRHGWPRDGEPRGGDPDYLMVRDGASLRLEVEAYRHALHTPESALSDHDLLLGDLRLAPRR